MTPVLHQCTCEKFSPSVGRSVGQSVNPHDSQLFRQSGTNSFGRVDRSSHQLGNSLTQGRSPISSSGLELVLEGGACHRQFQDLALGAVDRQKLSAPKI